MGILRSISYMKASCYSIRPTPDAVRNYTNEEYMDEQNTDIRWVKCPLCNAKTKIKLYKDPVLLNFPLYCPKCKKEIRIDVVQFKMVQSKEPDA